MSSFRIRAFKAGITLEAARNLSDAELDAEIARREREKARALKRHATEAAIRRFEDTLAMSRPENVARFARWLGAPADDLYRLARKAITHKLPTSASVGVRRQP